MLLGVALGASGIGGILFGYLADLFGRRRLFTGYSLLTAAAIYPLAFHWQ